MSVGVDGDKDGLTDLHPSYRLKRIGYALSNELRTLPLAWNSE